MSAAILVIEDDRTLSNNLSRYLIRHGFSVETSSTGSGILRVIGQGATYGSGEVLIVGNEGNNNFNAVKFRCGMLTVNNIVGSITCTPSSTAFNTSSDYRLKDNIQPMTNSIEKVKLLKPCTWSWKVDGSNGQGFVAHEVAEIVSQAVTGTKDAVDKDGKPEYQGMDYSKLVPISTSALQEAITKIEDLETRIQALESA